MATDPIHPEIQARADQLLKVEIDAVVNDGISPKTAKWTTNQLRGLQAIRLQEQVARTFNDCVAMLREELTEERKEAIWKGLQRLEHYPTIHGQLLEWIRSLAPNSGLIPGNLTAG